MSFILDGCTSKDAMQHSISRLRYLSTILIETGLNNFFLQADEVKDKLKLLYLRFLLEDVMIS